ncbi:MAG: hypothetical protein ACK5Q5_06170 [Planctomycetaceae bacterium]
MPELIRHSWPQRLGLALLLLSQFCLTSAAALAEPTSIPELLSRESQFGDLVGSTFHLEGRVSTLGKNELRMKGTDLRFVFSTGFERPRSPYVQLTGRLERDGREFRILVLSLSDYQPDAAVLKERLRVRDSSLPETYYDLADWVEKRGEFYADETLQVEAKRMRTLGIETAERRIAPDRPADWRDLADKASQWGLESRLRDGLLHAATRAELTTESRNPTPAYGAVLSRISERFPAAQQALAEIPDLMREMYAARPVPTYNQADEDQRLVLQRLLYLETVQKQVEAEAKPDGSNGYAMAERLSRLAPELAAEATRHRERELDYLESRVSRLDRTAVLEFRNKLREVGQLDRALSVVRRWIDQQLSRRPRGPDVDIDRAEFEYEMTGDTERALALVSGALALDPQAPGGAELLSLMGYGWYEGKAIRKELIPARLPDPFEKAIRLGKIVVGMSDGQVRAALGGAPDQVVRVATQGRVTELWHYSATRLTLCLEGTQLKPQLLVTKIVELTKAMPPATKLK